MSSFINCDVNYSNKNVAQPIDASNLLHLPQDVLKIITRNVAAGESSDMKSAIRAVEFGRVCANTHKLTHEDEQIETLLYDEKKFSPLVNFLEGSFGKSVGVDDLYRMRLLLEENDTATLQVKVENLFEDYLRDHPGLDREEAVEAFEAELKTFLDQEPNNNKKDLFKVFYAVFKKSFLGFIWNEISNGLIEEITPHSFKVAEMYENCVENASRMIASEPAELSGFLQKVHAKMIETYAKQPLEQLTIEKYLDLSRTFLKIFVPSHPQFHELHLRQALQHHHDKAEFETLRQKFVNPGLEQLHSMKEFLKVIRSAELKNVTAEIHAFCGDYFNGSIDAVYRRMVSAEKNMLEARAEYFESIEGQIALLNTTQDPDLIEKGHQRVNTLFQKHTAALEEYQNHRIVFRKYNERLAELAVWTNGVMTGGRKVELEAGLQEKKLTEDAYLECQKISEFYALLAQPIDENNKDEAYELIHNLIEG